MAGVTVVPHPVADVDAAAVGGVAQFGGAGDVLRVGPDGGQVDGPRADVIGRRVGEGGADHQGAAVAAAPAGQNVVGHVAGAAEVHAGIAVASVAGGGAAQEVGERAAGGAGV